MERASGGSARRHWTQQDKPDQLNRLMADWLIRRFRPA
jgi:hypothetical protein